MAITNLDLQLQEMAKSVAGNNLNQFLKSIFILKGIARQAQISGLYEAAADLEASLQALEGEQKTKWKENREIFRHLENEWIDVLAIANTFESQNESASQASEPNNYGKDQGIAHLEARLRFSAQVTAKSLQKKVRLQFHWLDVELPLDSMRMLREALGHLLNNGIDHGIETPRHRVELGKDSIGTFSVRAWIQDYQAQIIVEDDGAGIKISDVVNTAVRRKVVSQLEAESMSIDQRLALIFSPGISTRDHATAISGRGIGLDIVASIIAKSGGSISVSTHPGSGTQFKIQLPLK